MAKLFLCDYDECDMLECHRNMNFEEINTEPLIGENDGFWLLRGILKE